MREISFDVNLISKISFRASYCSDVYIWREEETVPKYKRILGIFKVRNGVETKPAGFYEERTHHYDFDGDRKYYLHATEEDLIRKGYLIKEFGNHGGVSYRKEAWAKSYVEVALGYKSSVGQSFNMDQEAKYWIEKLKKLSDKTFETIYA
jgi:hypothetical protein